MQDEINKVCLTKCCVLYLLYGNGGLWERVIGQFVLQSFISSHLHPTYAEQVSRLEMEYFLGWCLIPHRSQLAARLPNAISYSNKAFLSPPQPPSITLSLIEQRSLTLASSVFRPDVGWDFDVRLSAPRDFGALYGLVTS